MRPKLTAFLAFLFAACAASQAAPAGDAVEWQEKAAFFDARKDRLCGLCLHARLDEKELWPRLMREVLIDEGRHFDSHVGAGPHVMRTESPVDFGLIQVQEAKNQQLDDCSRTWSGARVSIACSTPWDEKFSADEGGSTLELLVSRLSPGVLVRATGNITLFAGVKMAGAYFLPNQPGWPPYCRSVGPVMPDMFAARGGEEVVMKSADEIGQLPAAGLESGWLLAWFGDKSWFRASARPNITYQWSHGGDKRWLAESYAADCPLLILFDNAVQSLDSKNGFGLDVNFAEGEGAILVLPLFGEYMPPAEETRKWTAGIPEDIRRKCDWWAGHLRKFPVAVNEGYAPGTGKDDIAVEEKFVWEDFRAVGSLAAPVPPTVAAAYLEGMPIEFSAAPHDPGLFTSSGPWLAVPEAESYRMVFKGLGRYVSERQPKSGASDKAPPALLGSLRKEVGKILDAGHLAPWMRQQKNIWLAGFVDPTMHLVHANPGETLMFLSYALPFLEPDMREKTLAYMRREREEFPPEKTGLLRGGQGARREAYGMHPEFLADTDQKSGPALTINYLRCRNFYVRNQLIPPETLYHLACYYEAVGADGLAQRWPEIQAIGKPYLERSDWATGGHYQWPETYGVSTYGASHICFSDFQYGYGGVVDINNHFAASIGHARLAALAGDKESEDMALALFARAAALRLAAGKMAGLMYKRGLLVPQPVYESPERDLRFPVAWDEYGMTLGIKLSDYFGGVSLFRDGVPELGAFLKDYSKAEAERYYGAFESAIPTWHMAWTDSGLHGECNCPWPQDAYQTFMAHAWIFDSPPEWLEKHLDVPWQARGDLFYLHKLVETIRAYGAQ